MAKSKLLPNRMGKASEDRIPRFKGGVRDAKASPFKHGPLPAKPRYAPYESPSKPARQK